MKISRIGIVGLALGITWMLSIGGQQPLVPANKPRQAATAKSDKSPAVKRLSSAASTSKPKPPVAAAQSFQAQPITYAQRVGDQVVFNGKKYPLRTYRAMMMPNDPSANQSWVTTANINAAWDIPRGSAPTLLAVVDTGVALNHQELQNRWYSNPGEQGPATSEAPSMLNCADRGLPLDQSCNLIDEDGDGIVDDESGATTLENPSRLNCTDQGLPLDKSCNNLDDDGNGFIDDVRGWDFAHGDNSTQDGEASPTQTGLPHGTYVSGVAAATGNNGVGMAGVDWGTTILPLQALDEDGTGYNSDVANAILYAAAKHADVINLSLGSESPDPLVRAAVQQAIAAGSVVVAAAGNDGCDCMVYPANYPEVLSVGAANAAGTLASFSSYGPNLDILAPGVNLFTTTWLPTNGTSAYAANISGTSLATPVISGLLTRLKSLQPNATPLELIAALTENTNRLSLTPDMARSDGLGFGLVNGGQASQRLVTPYTPVQRYIFTPISFGSGLNPSQPAEVAASTMAYQCENGRPGTTPVYELTKNGLSLFSASSAEVQEAVSQGYSTNFLSYLCLSEPHDQPGTVVRNINLYKEFRNLDSQK